MLTLYQVISFYILAQVALVLCAPNPTKPPVTNEHFVENYGEFPYLVALVDSAPSYFCSGTIISKNKVLTAANCVNRRAANSIKVHAGILMIGGEENAAQVLDVEEIQEHPQFRQSGKRVYQYDLAILRLKGRFRFNLDVNRIKVYGDSTSDDVLTAVSYGSVLKGRQLKITEVTQISSDECKKSSSKLLDSMICTKDTKEVDQRDCFNDYGGPLVKLANDPRNDVLVGVTAWVGTQCDSLRNFGFAKSSEYWELFRFLS